MRRLYKNLCPTTISASIMAANMWKNSLKNVESDNNKILYETLINFFYSETVLTFWISLVFCSSFSSKLIMSNFSSLLIVSRWFFTWIALGDVDLCYSLMLAWKTNTGEEETKWAMWLYYQHNRSIHVTDGVTQVSFFLASYRRWVRL